MRLGLTAPNRRRACTARLARRPRASASPARVSASAANRATCWRRCRAVRGAVTRPPAARGGPYCKRTASSSSPAPSPACSLPRRSPGTERCGLPSDFALRAAAMGSSARCHARALRPSRKRTGAFCAGSPGTLAVRLHPSIPGWKRQSGPFPHERDARIRRVFVDGHHRPERPD